MKCPRCERRTDREVYSCDPVSHVIKRTPLLCTACLDDIEVRSAMGELMVYANTDLPQTKGGHTS